MRHIKKPAARLPAGRHIPRRQLSYEPLETRRLLTEFLTPFFYPDFHADPQNMDVPHCNSAVRAKEAAVSEVGTIGGSEISESPSVPQHVDPLIRIAPHFVDRSGDPVERVETGQTVWLEFTATDMRATHRLGVFSTYFDVDFGCADVEIVGESEFSDAYWVLRIDPARRGWSNIGATQGLSDQTDRQRPWVLRVPIRFSTEGEITVKVAPGDEVHLAYSLLYGIDDEILSPSVEFGSATIAVTSSTDPQANGSEDESVLAIDTLSEIDSPTERNEVTGGPAGDEIGFDINGDRAIAAIGSSIQLNLVDNEREHDQAIAEVMDEEEDQRSLDDLDPHWRIDDIAVLGELSSDEIMS